MKAEISTQALTRRLIHSSIMMHLRCDDPVSTHLVIQSTEMKLNETIKKKNGIDEYLDFLVRQQEKYNKNRFITHVLRKRYNQIKHGNRDDILYEEDYFSINEVVLVFNIYIYSKFFGQKTRLMNMYEALFKLLNHDSIEFMVEFRFPEPAIALIRGKERALIHSEFYQLIMSDEEALLEIDEDMRGQADFIRKIVCD